MNKAGYRALFNEMMKYVKFNPFLKELNIPQANFSHFCNGFDHSMNIEKLEVLHHTIIDRVQKFA